MAKYNIIRNGYFTSTTESGTGNVSLSWAELESLVDGNLTSAGVTLTSSGILYLDVDLSQRIKIDGIRLYASDLTKASNIDFYYKNEESDSFTLLSTSVGSYYYTTISDPSAPRYIRATVSGININLYEFQIFNDDYIVGFGTDGQTYAEYISDTPIGEEGTPQAIAIYNDGDSDIPADAYVAIDFTGTGADYYLNISTSQNGTYYNISDGALMESDELDEKYRWSMGEFVGTGVSADTVVIGGPGLGPTIGRLGELPLLYNDYGLNVGANAMDYDRVNKKVYAIGMDGESSGPLKLFEYLYGTDDWTYIGEINPATQADDNFPVMAYCSVSGTDRIYCINTLAGGFGYYDLNGPQDNWTPEANPTWSYGLGGNDRVSMCSDGVRYIYALTSDYGAHDTNRNFKRFDTISGTWASLDGSYLQYNYGPGGSTSYPNITSLTYDYDRDRIYLHNNSEGLSNQGDYIQRYLIASDVWSTTFVDVENETGTEWGIYSISYHNNWIYIGPAPHFTDDYFYRYNVATSQMESYDLGWYYDNPGQGGTGVHILAIDPLEASDFESSVYFAAMEVPNRQYLYGYSFATVLDATYTTPIFKLNNKYNSSYFVIQGDTTSGVSSISYDEDVYNGTIRVRNSDTAPLTRTEILWLMDTNVAQNHDWTVDQHVIETGATNYTWADLGGNYYGSPGDTGVCNRRNGNAAFVFGTTGYQSSVRLYMLDHNGNQRYSSSSADYIGTTMLDFDKSGGLWGYSPYVDRQRLIHWNYELSSRIYDSGDHAFPTLTDMIAESDGDGAWFIETQDGLVTHVDEYGSVLHQIALPNPKALCRTSDSGCWVADNDDLRAYRYNSDGNLVQTINIGRELASEDEQWGALLVDDREGGFWYISYNHVYHVTSGGIEDIDVYVTQPATLTSGRDGCAVYSNLHAWVKYIDKSAGVVTRTFNASQPYHSRPALMSFSLEDYIDYQNTDTTLIPTEYDTVWGTGGTAEWLEVRKDGYFLPKKRYHRVEITLRGEAVLEKVIMAPAIKIQDIPKQDYKYMYIKTDIPESVDIANYESRLKSWWGVIE